MCSSPLTKDGNTFSCNRCNDCLAARRVDWQSRAMAEKAISASTLIYCLTYGNDTQEQRDGAAMFRYADIQGLLKRLRDAIYYRTGSRNALRFLCAGEQGSRNGRCHWHIVLFSDYDLATVGAYTDHLGQEVPPDRVVTTGRSHRRLRWSMWPHGFITAQEPDEGGMAYAIKYALKDQFSVQKSAGTMREAKADSYATGFFRMSKRPPIGWDYLTQKLEEWEARGMVPPSLMLSIPEATVSWYPRSSTRRFLLHGIRAINENIAARTGANAPQWSTLLHNCRDNESDMEILLNEQESETEESDTLQLRKKADYQRDLAKRGQTARRCGSKVACTSCLRGASPEQLQSAGIELYEDEAGRFAFRYQGDETSGRLTADQGNAKGGQLNSLCGLAETSYVKKVFTHSAPLHRFGATGNAR